MGTDRGICLVDELMGFLASVKKALIEREAMQQKIYMLRGELVDTSKYLLMMLVDALIPAKPVDITSLVHLNKDEEEKVTVDDILNLVKPKKVVMRRGSYEFGGEVNVMLADTSTSRVVVIADSEGLSRIVVFPPKASDDEVFEYVKEMSVKFPDGE